MDSFISATNVKKDLKAKSDPIKKKLLARYFKTGKGEYGEGDIFIGVMVGNSRKIAKKYKNLPLSQIEKLLRSKVHEERLTALLIMVENYKKAERSEKTKIFKFYLKNTKFINNWDLVDLSASKIMGEYLKDKSKKILFKFARSKNIWERRIAIISTFAFIKENNFNETLKVAQILLRDSHDLIHKAVGWALREVGNKDRSKEEEFLLKYYKIMPRTMLRYAIEKFSPKLRQRYLKAKI